MSGDRSQMAKACPECGLPYDGTTDAGGPICEHPAYERQWMYHSSTSGSHWASDYDEAARLGEPFPVYVPRAIK